MNAPDAPESMSEEAIRQDRAWQRYVHEIRVGEGCSFEDQWARFETIFRGRRAEDGPPPIWHPTHQHETSNLGQFMKAFALRNYPETHRWSVTDRAAFWNNVIDRLGIVFSRRPDTVLDLARSVKQPS